MEQLKIKRDQQLSLMETMDFSDEDLDLNRSGVLSDRQRRRLRGKQILDALAWWFIVGIGIFLLVVSNRRSPAQLSDQLMSLAVVALGVGMAFRQQYQINQALQENEVAVVTGPIKKTCRTGNKSQVYRASIGGQKFEVDKRTYDCLLEANSYSFYYVPQTGELMSVGQPLTAEEKIRFSFTRARDFEKQKRLVEPDTLAKGVDPEHYDAPPAYLSSEEQ